MMFGKRLWLCTLCLLMYEKTNISAQKIHPVFMGIRSNIIVSSLKNLNIEGQISSTILYQHIKLELLSCIRSYSPTRLYSIAKSLLFIASCLKKKISCTTDYLLWKEPYQRHYFTTNQLGCYHIFQSQTTSTYRYKKSFMEYTFLLKIQTHRDFITNVTLSKFQFMFTSKDCQLYKITIKQIATPEGPMTVTLCRSSWFTGDEASFLSDQSQTEINVKGFFKSQDNLLIIHQSRPKHQRFGFQYILNKAQGSSSMTRDILPFVCIQRRIRIDAWHNIILSTLRGKTSEGIIVFDGPGLKSEKVEPLKENNRVIWRPHFPNVVVLFHHSNITAFDAKLNVLVSYTKYESKPGALSTTCNPHYSEFHLKTNINISASKSLGSTYSQFCVWTFSVQPSLNVQITLTQWFYNGPSDIDCSYGGLFILEQPEEDTNTYLCGKMEEEIKSINNITIVSSNSKMALQFAAYHPYSSARFSALLSVGFCLALKNVFSRPKRIINEEYKKVSKLIRYGRHGGDQPCAVLEETDSMGKDRGRLFELLALSVDVTVNVMDAQCIPMKALWGAGYIYNEDECQFSHKASTSGLHREYTPIGFGPESQDSGIPGDQVIRLWYNKVSFFGIEVVLLDGQQTFTSLNLTSFTMPDDLVGYVAAGMQITYSLLYWEQGGILIPRLLINTGQVTNLNTHLILKANQLAINGVLRIKLTLCVYYIGECMDKCARDVLLIKIYDRKTKEILYKRTINEIKWPSIYPLTILSTDQTPQIGMEIIATRMSSNSSICANLTLRCNIGFFIGWNKVNIPPYCPHCIEKSKEKGAKEQLFCSQGIPKCYLIPYKEFSRPISWNKARQECQSRGGDLGAIDLYQENLFESLQTSLFFKVHQQGYSHILSMPVYIGLKVTKSESCWINGGPVLLSKGIQGVHVMDYVDHNTHRRNSPYTSTELHQLEFKTYPSVTNISQQEVCHENFTSGSEDLYCGAVYDLIPGMKMKWRLYPCDEPFNATYICALHHSNTIPTKVKYDNTILLQIVQNSTYCSEQMLHFRYKCLVLIRSKKEGGSWATGCESNGLSWFEYLYTDDIYKYTSGITHSRCFIMPGIFLTKYMQDDFRWLFYKNYAQYLNASVQTNLNCDDNYFYYCQSKQRDDLLNSSVQNTVQCESGEYIWEDYVCDGHVDCFSQEDEANCSKPCHSILKNGSSPNCAFCKTDTCRCNATFFQCPSGGCLSMELLCDKTSDCQDGSDEMACMALPCGRNDFDCKDGSCIPLKYHCDGKPDCASGDDESKCTKACDGHTCSTGKCIEESMLNDLVPDCPLGEDEEEFSTLDKFHYTFKNYSCTNGMLPCFPGHSRCFSIDKVCLYDSFKNQLLYCPNAGHLRFCENMDCPGLTFKCKNAFCIPLRRFCDGVSDCPDEEDEYHCPQLRCPPGFYKCKGSVKCLPMREICDGVIQCTMYGEDESICVMLQRCPHGCLCHFHSLRCHNSNQLLFQLFILGHRSFLTWKNNLRVLTLIQCGISNELSYIALQARYLRYLDLSHNEIDLPLQPFFISHILLHYCDLSFNSISALPFWIISKFPNIGFLNMSNNLLTFLDFDLFHENPRLHTLDISFNSIKMISCEPDTITHFGFLNVVGNTLVAELMDLNYLRVENIVTDEPALCCRLLSAQNCIIAGGGEADCSDMLSHSFTKTLYWLIGFLMWVLWTLSMAVHIRTKALIKINTLVFIQQNSALADILQGIYLISTGIADYKTMQDYPLIKEKWLMGTTCLSLRTLNLLGLFQSYFLLTFRNIFYYYKTKVTSMAETNMKVNIGIICSWFVFFSISLLISILSHKTNVLTNEPNILCNAFFVPITNYILYKVEYIPATLFITWYFLMCILFFGFNIAFIQTLLKTKMASRRKNFTRTEKHFFKFSVFMMLYRLLYFIFFFPVTMHGYSWVNSWSVTDLYLSVNPLLNLIISIVRILPKSFKYCR